MIPLRRERRSPGLPLTTWLMSLLCAAAMLRVVTLPPGRAASIVDALAVVPSRITAHPVDGGQLITLLTSQFLHAGWVHLVGNLLFLAVFGPAVEHRLGRRGFAALYLACGVIGSSAYALSHPGSQVALIGASGAIAGVLGAHLVLEPRARLTTLVPAVFVFEVASLPAAFVVALWFAAQLASNVAPVTHAVTGGGVAWVAHISGFLAGAILVLPVAIGSAVHRMRTRRRRLTVDSRKGRAA